MTDEELARLNDLLEMVSMRDCYEAFGGPPCPLLFERVEWCESCAARDLLATLQTAGVLG